MKSKVLTNSTPDAQPIDGAELDRRLLSFRPIDPAVLMVLQHLQAQIDTLTTQLAGSTVPS